MVSRTLIMAPIAADHLVRQRHRARTLVTNLVAIGCYRLDASHPSYGGG
jgi:hypothetical protein